MERILNKEGNTTPTKLEYHLQNSKRDEECESFFVSFAVEKWAKVDKILQKCYNGLTNAGGHKRRKERAMKKTLKIAVLLCLATVMICLASCNKQPATPQETTPATTTPAETTPDGKLPEEAVKYSTGLEYITHAEIGDGNCFIVSIGTCEDTDICIPPEIDGYKVIGIAPEAFNECEHLTSVTFPNTLVFIGDGAFNACYGLTSITIPDSVQIIDSSAFHRCENVTSITIPNSVTEIRYGAFAFCLSLTSVTIPDSITKIDDSVFMGCENLISVTIPNSVTSIDSQAFAMCYSMTSITIPDSVTSIGVNAFFTCTSLTTITFEGTVEQWNAMTFGDNWNLQVPATEIICSGGVVPMN